MSEDPRHAVWRAEFEKLGETSVRMIDPGSHVILDDRVRFSKVWLAELDAAKRDAREMETLSIAKDANNIARSQAAAAWRAARYAMYAAAIAAIAALFASKDEISKLFQ
jgi:hypothetical protein